VAGQIHRMVEKIVQERSQGDITIAHLTKAKLALRGILFSKYSATSDDDPHVIEKLRQIAAELGVKL